MGERISDDELRRLVAEVHEHPLKAAKDAGQVRSDHDLGGLVADVYGLGPNCDSYAEITELFALAPALAAEVLQLREALAACVKMLNDLVVESGRSIEWGEEDPFRMGEWFDDENLADISRARAALTGGHSNG